MNILLINGSPKGERSNTLRLSNAFLDGVCDALAATPPSIRRLDVSKLDIRPCLGCFSCWKNTPGQCCIRDDMRDVLNALLWADLTVWSFPLYYFNLPGKLKTLIDRQLPLTLPFMVSGAEGGSHPSRYDMSGKRTVLISTCGFYTPNTNYDSVTAQFDRMCGKGNYTTLFCGEGELFRVPELSSRTDAYLAVVKRAGREYACGGIHADTDAQLHELLFPRDVFERMADASWGITPTGEKEDDSLVFTKQMAALYNPSAYRGRDIVLDMDYTDIGKRYRIVLGKTGSRVTDDFSAAPTTVIHTPLSVWQAIAAGEIEGSAALMEHRYRVEGDFYLMLKWGEYFGGHTTAEPAKAQTAAGKTTMRYLLTPWVVFWVAASIHAFWGSLLSILACCALPLIFFRNRKTVYDVVSAVLVGVFCALLLAEVPKDPVMMLSYIAFGLMWSLSALRKIPLSAEYSMNDYGGDDAMRNPIFLKTNRILTVAWGILYLVAPVLTYLVIPAAFRTWAQILNYILPAIMGVFTAWFQRWYPQKVARGGK